jgi:hypothetical protein
VLVDGDELARLYLPDEGGPDDVQGRCLAGYHPAARQAAEDQRPEAMRVTGGVQGPLVHEDEGEGTPHQREGTHRALFHAAVRRAARRRREQGGQDVGVRGGLARPDRAGRDQRGQFQGVDQVAVVTQGQPGGGRGPERGLGVLPVRGPGGGVPAVADGDMAAQGAQHRLVKDLRHEPHVLVDDDPVAVADRYARRFLAAVLKGVQAEVGQLGDVLVRRPGAKDTAGVAGRVVVGIEIIGQAAIRLDHLASLSDIPRRKTPGPGFSELAHFLCVCPVMQLLLALPARVPSQSPGSGRWPGVMRRARRGCSRR